MKKLLCALIFCLSFISAFAWEVVPLTDEFGDPVKEKGLVYKEARREMFLRDGGSYDLFLLTVSVKGKEVSTGEIIDIVRVKIDDSKPFEVKSLIDTWGFATGITREQLDMLANGKKAKFSIPNKDGSHSLEIFDLTGLKEIVHEIY